MDSNLACDLLVLGGGPGGYSAAFRAADLGLNVTLVERYEKLGGVCLNVGCIPTKSLLHVAASFDGVRHLAEHNVAQIEPAIMLDGLRAHQQNVVGKLTSGLQGMAKARRVNVIQGIGRFLDKNRIHIDETAGADAKPTGNQQTLSFRSAIVAAGSQSIKLPFLPDDPRIVDSTGALRLTHVPKRMLIIGGGIIGLEMGTVYSSLFGTRLDLVEMSEALMPGVDSDLVAIWRKANACRFDNIMLGTRAIGAEATPSGIRVRFEGGKVPLEPQEYDLVLQCVGRRPNGKLIGAELAGLDVSADGFIRVDQQLRTSTPHIFAIGDIVGQPMLAHKAVHEAHVAAEVAAGDLLGEAALQRAHFDARVIPGVSYTNPEVAWVGVTEQKALDQQRAIDTGVFPWAASGRAIANGYESGVTKLVFDKTSGRIIGGAIVGPHAGDLIGGIALAIEMGADAVDIAKTIHPHPTLGESIGMAAEAALGHCTDLPPVKRRVV